MARREVGAGGSMIPQGIIRIVVGAIYEFPRLIRVDETEQEIAERAVRILRSRHALHTIDVSMRHVETRILRNKGIAVRRPIHEYVVTLGYVCALCRRPIEGVRTDTDPERLAWTTPSPSKFEPSSVPVHAGCDLDRAHEEHVDGALERGEETW